MWQEFLQQEVKPHTKDKLIGGIHQFCGTVTVEKCARNICRLHTPIPVPSLSKVTPLATELPLSLSFLVFKRFFSEPPYLRLVHFLCYSVYLYMYIITYMSKYPVKNIELDSYPCLWSSRVSALPASMHFNTEVV